MGAARSTNFARDRKCERCERIFLATTDDVKAHQYKCKECRSVPEHPKEYRKPVRGEFNPYPGRHR